MLNEAELATGEGGYGTNDCLADIGKVTGAGVISGAKWGAGSAGVATLGTGAISGGIIGGILGAQVGAVAGVGLCIYNILRH